MGLARKLFINWHTRKRQLSDLFTGPDAADTLVFRKYEIIPFEVVIVEPDVTRGPSFFKRVDITDLTMEMAVNDTFDDATPLAHAASGDWTKNTNTMTFSGSLNLNTAAVATFMAADSQSAYFEVRVLTSGGDRVPVYSDTCTLKKGVLQTTTTTPDPAKMYLDYGELKGLFVQRVMEPGETITWRDANGVNYRIFGVRADGSPQDDAI